MSKEKSGFRIAAAQSCSITGAVTENIDHHIALVRLATEKGAQVILFPELSLTGYEPSIAASTALSPTDPALGPLQATADDLNTTLIVGCPIRSQGSKPYLGAFIIRPGQEIGIYRKRFLHGEEKVHFSSSKNLVVLETHGKSMAIAICADINNPTHARDLAEHHPAIYAAGVAMTPEDIQRAEKSMSDRAQRYGFVAVMANYAAPTGTYETGGRSAVWNKNGDIMAQAPESGECLVLACLTPSGWVGSIEILD